MVVCISVELCKVGLMGSNFLISNGSSYFCTCSTWKHPITLMGALYLMGLMWLYHTIPPPLLWSYKEERVRLCGRVQTMAWVWAAADSHCCLCTLLSFYLCSPEQAVFLGALLPFSAFCLLVSFFQSKSPCFRPPVLKSQGHHLLPFLSWLFFPHSGIVIHDKAPGTWPRVGKWSV